MASYISTINRLRDDIARLHKDEADLVRKEADASKKLNRAREDASRAKSASTLSSKLREAERAADDMASLAKRRAELSAKLASKSRDLHSYLDRQAKEDENDRKRVAREQDRLIRERDAHTRRLTSALEQASRSPAPSQESGEQYDFFISHASEDKEGFVRNLATKLRDLGATVFYDEFTLRIGDSLRRKIDQGLSTSRFGVVVLSSAFFSKEWPQKELDGLTAMEVGGRTRILPIWHKVSKDEVAAFSPTLADKVALNTSLKSADEIAQELHDLLS